ncbi:hypothetical protein GRI40_10040 [Altererythrobacter aerius]|uniref:Uncharacterized protein n=1 Tax=Tsuneonella aeria TaxID=1837929 RepID=A0A6I4TFW3_9SPHN|nr:hypothetical protein [Tsuneonella aeria]MXO75556.1 hypothetical protein [Tsuneonella aeria]
MSDKQTRMAEHQASVTAHPAFPVIVSLWLASLCAIAATALPVALVESLARSSGLAAIAEAVDAGARIPVVLAAFVLGGIAGLFVARRIAAAKARARVAATEASPTGPTRPILAVADIGSDGFDEPEPAAAPCEAAEPAGTDATMAPEDRPNDESVEHPRARGVEGRPLSELGTVELVERFAIALQRHRAEEADRGARAYPAPQPPLLADDDADAFVNDSHRAPATASPFTAPRAPTRPGADFPEQALRDALAKLERLSRTA